MTTIVLDARFDNLPGVEYYEVEVDGKPVRFAQHDRTVLPAMLEELVSLQRHPVVHSRLLQLSAVFKLLQQVLDHLQLNGQHILLAARERLPVMRQVFDGLLRHLQHRLRILWYVTFRPDILRSQSG